MWLTACALHFVQVCKTRRTEERDQQRDACNKNMCRALFPGDSGQQLQGASGCVGTDDAHEVRLAQSCMFGVAASSDRCTDLV